MTSAPRKNVLVVDDNLDLADGLSWILEAEGQEVTTAYSAEEALEKIAAADFDVVVLDFKLPGLTGFAARRAIQDRLPRAQVVTMSGWSVDQLLAHELGPEAVRVLRYPFSNATLAAVTRALAGGGALLVAGIGEESARSLHQQIEELGTAAETATSAAEARRALDGSAALLVLDFARPIVEMLDVFFELRETRAEALATRLTVIHARPMAPPASGEDLLAAQPTSGLFVKPMFDFDDVLRVVRGA